MCRFLVNLIAERWTPTFYWISATLLMLLVILISVAFFRSSVSGLVLRDYNRYSCHLETQTPGKAVFRILSLSRKASQALADRLCHSRELSKFYGSVDIVWRPRDYLTLADIQNSRFHLFFNREHMVKGTAPNYELYYTRFHESPSYALDWLSLESPPEFTTDYFSHKTIGLLADPHSQSFHIEPLDSLTRRGISVHSEQLHFYPDVQSLFKGFRQGEVALVSSPRDLFIDQIPVHQRLEINAHMSPGSWYLAHIVAPQVRCELHQALSGFNQGVFGRKVSDNVCR
ncbi:MAG: hypothetical protein ACPGYX_07575 [Oceanobacter sp.]